MIKLIKKFRFDSAHYLPNHPGMCRYLHGHTYHMNIIMKGEIDEETGMVIDFNDIDVIVKKNILNIVDHQCLNDIFDFIPTAENIAKEFFNILKRVFKDLLESVEIFETETAGAIYSL